MSNSSFDIKEQIRDAIDIVDLVSRYVSLTRQGRVYVGRCPWHDDSRPSLQVNPERQTFKCWVCDLGGDIFSFMMLIERSEFRESLEMLAEIAGIALKKSRPFQGGFSQNQQSIADTTNAGANSESAESGYQPVEISKITLYRALNWLSQKYHDYYLTAPEAQGARDYIRKRGINEEMVRLFRIGFAPSSTDTLLQWIGYDRNRVNVLVVAGVLYYKGDDSAVADTNRAKEPILTLAERFQYVDRFRCRLLFPIRVQENVVAFGGRLLPDSTLQSPAKYVNSPETLVFTKNKTLYGFDIAQNAIRKGHRVLITEGYTDCIMAHRFGFPETVAVLGTALGAEHVKLLKRFADKMILILDGDTAGKKRALEVLGHFVSQGVDLSIVTLPEEQDPCDYLLANGHEAMEQLLREKATDAMDHAFRAIVGDIDVDRDIIGASHALDKLIEIVALFPTGLHLIDDPVRLRMEKTIQRLAGRFHIGESEIRKRLAEHRTHRNRFQSRESERFIEYDDAGETGEAPASFDNQTEAMNPDEQISRNRMQYIYPTAGPLDETDNDLQNRFEKFPREILNDSRFAPNQLETEFLQLWLTCPDALEPILERVALDELRSPVTRQLTLLAIDIQKQGRCCGIDEILLRYDDESMKSYIIGLDERAMDKDYAALLQSTEARSRFIEEIIVAFARVQFSREEPKTLHQLRESDLGDEAKMNKLLEIQQLLMKKQQIRSGITDHKDEGGPRSE